MRYVSVLIHSVVLTAGLAALLMHVGTDLPVSFRISIVGLVVAACLLIYALLSQLIPWLINQHAERLPPQLLVAQTITSSAFVAALVASLLLLLLRYVWDIPLTFAEGFFSTSLFAIITAGVTSVYSLKSFVQRWKSLLLMEEELKRAVLKAEFDSLKNQVNPHFLFNSLNILSALIPEDTGKSVQFVERLSKVFRYNLQHTDQNTVQLATELKIAESYLFIHHMRFGENFGYQISLPAEQRQKQIVTQGLLTLLENVVKHNEISRERPLTVRIFSEADCLVVANTYQPRNRLRTDSTGIGLRNLQSRCNQLSERPVAIEQTATEFVVKLPLL